eukprot:tig00020934_g16092.t1
MPPKAKGQKKQDAMDRPHPKYPQLTMRDVEEFKAIFNLVDLDGSGAVSKGEIKSLMQTLGLNPSDQELDGMVAAFLGEEEDPSADIEINFDQFVRMMETKVRPPFSSTEIKEAFRVFEVGSREGFVRLADLEKALMSGPGAVTREEARDLLAPLDKDKASGVVNYFEFVHKVMAGLE